MSNVNLARAEKIVSLADDFLSRYLICTFHTNWQFITYLQVSLEAKLCPRSLGASSKPGKGESLWKCVS